MFSLDHERARYIVVLLMGELWELKSLKSILIKLCSALCYIGAIPFHALEMNLRYLQRGEAF